MLDRRLVCAIAVVTVIATIAPAHQELAPEKTESRTPLFLGERLVYKVQWDPPWFLFFLPHMMEAGEISSDLSEAEYNGRKALKIHFEGRSSGRLTKLAKIKIEDEYTFYTEPETFCTFSGSTKIREGKRRRQIDVQYSRDTRQLHIREVDEGVVPPKVKKEETKTNIPECVHDPLSAIYLYRLSPLKQQYSETLVLANDDKIKDIRAVVEAQDTIDTASGKVSTWRVGVVSLMGGLFKEKGQFKIWFSADEKKVPLQFEVKVGLGRVFGSLKPPQ